MQRAKRPAACLASDASRCRRSGLSPRPGPAAKARLRIAPWDGYLKYYNLGEKVGGSGGYPGRRPYAPGGVKHAQSRSVPAGCWVRSLGLCRGLRVRTFARSFRPPCSTQT